MATATTAQPLANGANGAVNTTTTIAVRRLSPLSPSLFAVQNIDIAIQLLDDDKFIQRTVKKESTGQDVLDYVCKQLGITDKEYFGLRTQDLNRYRYWIDSQKSMGKQFPNQKHITLRFRVRFYPVAPQSLLDSVARYHIFVQLQRDLIHGRLSCPSHDGAELGALILQSALGDYSGVKHGENPSDYVSEYTLMLKQSKKLEDSIASRHRELRGMSPGEAESKFLSIASTLETYGFDPYVVKDVSGGHSVALGTSTTGVIGFLDSKKISPIKWMDVAKVDYSGKCLTITPASEYFNDEMQSEEALASCKPLLSSPIPEEKEKAKLKKLKFVFNCPSAQFAKHLWRHILSQQAFHTADCAKAVKLIFSKPRIPLLMRGSTFRCPTGRVENELKKSLHENESGAHEVTGVERYALRKMAPRSQTEPWNASQNGGLTLNFDGTPGTPLAGTAINTPVSEVRSVGTSGEDDGVPSPAVNAPVKEARFETASHGTLQANGAVGVGRRVGGSVNTTQRNFLQLSLVVALVSILLAIVMIFVLEMDDTRLRRTIPQLSQQVSIFKRNYYNALKARIWRR